MEDRDWVWVIILIGSQLLMWRIYSVHLWYERRKHNRRLEELDRKLEWYEAQSRLLTEKDRRMIAQNHKGELA